MLYRKTFAIALTAVALALPTGAHADGSYGGDTYRVPGATEVDAPCFVRVASGSPELTTDGLHCNAETAAAAPPTLSGSCNGRYYYPYNAAAAQSVIYGSVTESNTNVTWVRITCVARYKENGNGNWIIVHRVKADAQRQNTGSSLFASTSLLTYLPPPPVHVPTNLCWEIQSNATPVQTTNC